MLFVLHVQLAPQVATTIRAVVVILLHGDITVQAEDVLWRMLHGNSSIEAKAC